MKAVIVECSNGAAVALCDDGSFKKLKNKGYFIGQELLLKQKASVNRVVQKLSICASLALVLLSFAGIGSYSYVKPYSFVSLDINPSIEYALNRYDKVISVSGVNDEGKQVASSIASDIKNQNITTALGVTIRQLEKDNYIMQEEYNHVIVSVCSANDSKAQSIASSVNTFSMEETRTCSIDAMTVSKEIKDNADSLGITPGKLALIHAVAETIADSDFDVSEWTDKTVNELEITIQQAASQSPAETLINSEYLSSVLDDSTATKADGTVAASAAEAGTLTGSTSTDQQTSTNKGTTTTGSSTQGSVSASRPDQAGTAAADSSGTGKAEGTGSTGKADASSGGTADNGSAADPGSSANQAASGKPSDKDSSADTSKGNSGSDTKNETVDKPDDSLTEDSSSKKDPYAVSDTDTLEVSSNTTDLTEDAGSSPDTETQEFQEQETKDQEIEDQSEIHEDLSEMDDILPESADDVKRPGKDDSGV